jgi:AcrR family transcriptional regulator
MSSTSPTGRALQARAVRSREALLLAAATVFDRESFESATLDQIASEAGAAKGRLLYHFGSKAILANAVVSGYHVAWTSLMLQATHASDLTGLAALDYLIDDLTRSILEDPIVRAGIRLSTESAYEMQEAREPFTEWVEFVAQLLRRGKRDASVGARINSAEAARAVVGSFFGIAQMSYRLRGLEDLRARVDGWWGLVRVGLAADPSTRPLRRRRSRST